MKAAFNRMSKSLTKLWFDKVTITGVQDSSDGVFTDGRPVTIVEDEPAKVVLKGLKASEQTFFGTDQYDVVMYVRTGLNIPAGCDVWVTDVNGQVIKYKQTGRAYTGYVTHQEVAMIRDEKAKEEADE